MSLSEIMSAANLDGYAQVALIAFMIAFALILWRVFSPRNKATYDHARFIPLEDEGERPRGPGR